MQPAIKKVIIITGAKCVAPTVRAMSYQRNYRLVRPPLAIYKRNTALVAINGPSVRHYASWDKKDPEHNESSMFKKGQEAAEAVINVAQKSTEFMSEAAQKAYTAGKNTVMGMTGNAEDEFAKKSAEAKHAAQSAVQKGKESAEKVAHRVEAEAKGVQSSAKDFVSSSKEFVSGAVDATKDAINKRGDKD